MIPTKTVMPNTMLTSSNRCSRNRRWLNRRVAEYCLFASLTIDSNGLCKHADILLIVSVKPLTDVLDALVPDNKITIMGKLTGSLSKSQQAFVEAQKVFFVATAAQEGRVNLSPKGMDSLRVLGPTRIAWLNLTGSGNETAAHVLATSRMTLMWCAFEGSPVILRAYGQARMHQPSDPTWEDMAALFPLLASARQVFDLHIESVQSSCGMGVPLYDYQGDRNDLITHWEKKGEKGVHAYQQKKNHTSLDGMPTGLPKV